MISHHNVSIDGIDLSHYEWSGEPPSVLFVHATGFHARIWDQVITHLPGHHCFAVDLRGHGFSGKPAEPPEWHYFAEDLIALGEHLGWSGLIGVGHSIGGHAITAAAASKPGLFSRLLLIDPVILPEQFYVGVVDLGHFAAKRRSEWTSPDEMFQRFKERPPFNRWEEAVLRDYVEYGLVPNPSGSGYVLACEPAFEAVSYNYGSGANIYPQIATITIPVTILRASGGTDASVFNMSASPTAPDLASRFPNAQDVYLPQHSHFIPMEAPELVADWVLRLIADQASARSEG